MIAGVRVNFKTRTLTRGDCRLRLGPVAFRVVTALLATPHGVLKPAMIEHVWGDDPDGGPDSPASVLHTVCSRYAKPLEHLGLALTRGRYNKPFAITDRWKPAERVRHLAAALGQATAIAARSEWRRASLADQVAAELERISA